MKRFLKRIYHSSPPFVINTYLRFYAVMHKLSYFYLPIHYYSGKSKEGGHIMNFIYIGNDIRIINYWLDRLFIDSKRKLDKKYIFIWNISNYLRDKNTKGDLALIELTHPKLDKKTVNLFGFIIPRWVQMHADVSNSIAIIKKDGEILRQIKKNSFEIEKTCEEEDFNFFYYRMYKPHIEKRHKGSALVEDYQVMLHHFKRNNSRLFFIGNNGSRLAGLFEMNYSDIPHLYANGVLDGSQEILKMSAIGALYYFAFLDYNLNHIKRINMGGTSPLLTDGVTKFKFSLGSYVSEIQSQLGLKLKLVPLGNTQLVRDFFLANAFMPLNNNEIVCTFFAEDKKQDLKSIIEKLHLKRNAFNNVKTKIYYIDAENQLIDI